jgi:hypothetical protein
MPDVTEEYVVSTMRREYAEAKKAGATRQIVITIDFNQGNPLRGRIQRNEEIKPPPATGNVRREVREG